MLAPNGESLTPCSAASDSTRVRRWTRGFGKPFAATHMVAVDPVCMLPIAMRRIVVELARHDGVNFLYSSSPPVGHRQGEGCMCLGQFGKSPCALRSSTWWDG